jgi:acyl carrier protein
MNEVDFLSNIAEILEVDENKINLDTDFRKDVDDFDSLKGFSMIVFFEDECEKIVTVEQFLNAKTIGDLYKLVN